MLSLLKNGEGGIRTHAPLRTNGFQDRLVMTTSIPLHISFVVCRTRLAQRQLVFYHPNALLSIPILHFFIFYFFQQQNAGYDVSLLSSKRKSSATGRSSGVVIFTFL